MISSEITKKNKMSKFSCIVLCAVAVSLNRVYADLEEVREGFHAAIKPFVIECAKELGISEAEFRKAKESHNPDSLGPCFAGCVLKKFGIINDKGEYDVAANIEKMKTFVKNEDQLSALSDVGKKCESINSESVSDGEAGCERAVMLLKCYSDHKSEIPM